MENKALGKGLSALIPKGLVTASMEKKERENAAATPAVSAVDQAMNKEGVLTVDTHRIKLNSVQPREHYAQDKIDELKASIKEKGILQPILVRTSGDGYEVIAGERRLRAAKALNLPQIPVVVRNVTDREALVLALIENMQREGLNPVEEAKGFKKLIEEYNFTQDSVADSVGKDRSTITNLLRLLKLPKPVLDVLAKGDISVGHARALLSIEDQKSQITLATEIVAKGLSVRKVEELVKVTAKNTNEQKPKKSKNRDIEILEEELSRVLGTKVVVEDKGNKGKLVIEYYTLADFDRIMEVIRR